MRRFFASWNSTFAKLGFKRDRRRRRRENRHCLGRRSRLEPLEERVLLAVAIPGDFNGDGRIDNMTFDTATYQFVNPDWQNHTGPEPSVWGDLPLITWENFWVGDYNGDGRDDVAARHTPANKLFYLISEGNRFRRYDGGTPVLDTAVVPWSEVFVGDFDGDGSDELLGWNPSGSGVRTPNRWEMMQFDERQGFQFDTGIGTTSGIQDWGNALRGNGIATNITVGDVNRDGRDDLVARQNANPTSAWQVALSTVSASGANEFTQYDFGTWFNGHTTDTAQLLPKVDDTYQEFLDIFSEVYNTVEVEFYPGLMKGIEATAQTKAGNDWDQAALLVDRLDAAGFESWIAYGTVTADWQAAAAWTGTTSNVAAFRVIKGTLDGTATQPDAATVRFKHGWVRVKVPTTSGFVLVDVDPSWKFKDRQAGVSVDLTNVPSEFYPIEGRPGRGTFDEFEYLTYADADQLPAEWYEDRVMKYLIDTGANKSLADVPYDGPIVQKQFEDIPVGWGGSASVFDSNPNDMNDEVDEYGNFLEIVSSESLRNRLTHRATISIERDHISVGRDFQTDLVPDYRPAMASRVISTSAVNWYPEALGGNSEVQSGSYTVNGTHFLAVPLPSSYDITANTRIRFDLNGTASISGVHFLIGLDTNSSNNGPDVEHNTSLDDLYTTGSGTKQIDIPASRLSNYATLTSASRAVFGLYKVGVGVQPNQAQATFTNVYLYENDNTTVIADSIIWQVDSATAAIDLPTPYAVTANTRLEFEFGGGSEGHLHAIGWDSDFDGTNDAAVPYKRFKLDGTTTPLGYGSAAPQGPISADGFLSYSIAIGSHLAGGATATMERLLFITGAGSNVNAESVFRNVRLREANITSEVHLSHTVVIAEHSLDSFTVDYVKQENSPSTTGDDTYAAKLSIKSPTASTTTINANAGKTFNTNDEARIRVEHFGPSDFQTGNPDAKMYSRKPGQIHAIGFDANQYSREFIVGLQAGLNDQISDGAQASDIDELLGYAAAKYWYEFNRSNRTIDGLLRTVGGQQWVGSGIVTSDPYILTQPIPGLNGGVPVYTPDQIAHLQYPILPHNMGVDLPNLNHVSFDIGNGIVNGEAFQLVGYNGSSLENAILEDVINSPSISTIRGLRKTMTDLGFVYVFESVWENNHRTIYRRGFLTPGGSYYGSTNTLYPFTPTQIRNDPDSVGLEGHSASVIDQIVSILENTNGAYASETAAIRVLIPSNPSVEGNWSGSVFVAEYDTADGGKVGSYIIAPDGGTPTSGGYSGNQRKAQNLKLPPATFVNQTFAGDPVNVANGNMFRDEVDFTFANPVIPLDLARHYDSQNKLDVGFGVGWVHSFTGIIYQEQDPANPADMDFVWLRGSGERHIFEDTTFTLPNTLFGQRVTTGAGASQRLTQYLDKDGTKYIFEAIANPFTDPHTGKQIYGRLISIQNPTGDHGVNITYEPGTSHVTKVESRSVPSRYLQFTYTSTVVDVKRFEAGVLAGTWSYVLTSGFSGTGSSGNRLTQVKHGNVAGVVTNYEYYTDGPNARKGLIKKITEPNGEFHEYEYYSNGRVFRVTDGNGAQQSFSYNLFRNLTEFTDERGNVETYHHQDNGLLTKQVHPDGSRLQFSWGATDSDEEFLMKTSTDEVGANETFTYWQPGESHSYRATNQSVYRPGELKQSVSENGVVTDYQYWVSSNSSYQYISGLSRIIVDPISANLQTEFTRDTFGNVLTAKDAEGNTTSYEYYDASAPAHLRRLRKSETLPKGVAGPEAVNWQPIIEEFTITGDMLSVRLLTGDDPTRHVAADAIRIDRLDGDGVFTKIVDDDYTESEPNFRFDPAGIHWESSGHAQVEYGGDARVLAGSPTVQGSATWIFTELLPGTYRISATWVYGSDRENDAIYEVYRGLPDGTPDGTSDPISQQNPATGFHSYQTVFEYDTAGSVVRSVTEGLPAGRRAYDAFGNVVYEEDPTGVATVYTYNALGRLVKSTVVDPKIIKFSAGNVLSYSGETTPNTWQVLDSGNTLHLSGDNRKAVSLNSEITPNTILEFDLDAPVAGDWYGVSVGNSLTQIHSLGLKLGGADPLLYSWKSTFNNYQAGSGPRHYQIPLGQTYSGTTLAGTYNYLIFTSADSVPSNGIGPAQTYFSNVRIYEAAGPSTVATTTYAYDLSGRLESTTDALNRATSYDYDDAGRLIKTTFADATFTTHDYDAVGNCVAITDEMGRTTRFVYDSRNRLVQAIYADGSTTRTRYDGAGRVLATIDELGHETQFTYDKEGGLLTTTHKQIFGTTDEGTLKQVNKYDALGRIVESVDAEGIITKYKRDELGRVTQTTVLDKTHVSTSDAVPVTPNAAKAPIFVSTTDYDANGNVANTAVYDPLQLPSGTNNYSGLLNDAKTLINSFNESANTIQVVRITYNTFGRAVEVTNADGTKTATIYDAAGRVRFTIDELGRRTEHRYDGFGRLERTVSPDPDGLGPEVSPYVSYVYNAAGELLAEWEYVGPDNQGSNQLGHELETARWFAYDARGRMRTRSDKYDAVLTRFVYDKAGQLVATVTPLQNANYNQYDERGRVIAEWETDPDGNAGSQFSPVTRFEYDAAGNVIATTDPLGNTTWFEYDSLGRLRKESRLHTLIADDADGGNASFSPSPDAIFSTNLADNLGFYGNDATVWYTTAPSPQQATWTFSNLEAGAHRVSMTWLPWGLYDPAAKIEILVNGTPVPFFRDGALMSSAGTTINQRKTPNDFRTVHGGAELNWEIVADEIAVTAGATVSIRMIHSGTPSAYLLADAVRLDRLVSQSFDYDKNGNVTAETDPLGRTTNFVYDELGRQTTVRLPDPDGAGALGRLETKTVYDGYGNVVSTIENRSTTTTTDDRTNTFAYDRRNRLTTETINSNNAGPEKLVTAYEYDAVGNTTLVTDPLGFQTHFRYDDLNREIDRYEDFAEGDDSAQTVTFDQQTLLNQAPMTYTGSATIASGGAAVTLNDDAWFYAPVGVYIADHRTVLEFEVELDYVPQYLFVGFDSDTTYSTSDDQRRWFDLGGRIYIPETFNTEFRLQEWSSGTVRVHIPIGQYLTDAEKAGGLSISHISLLSSSSWENPVSAFQSHVTFSDVRLYQSDEVRTVTSYDPIDNVVTVREASDPRNVTTRLYHDRLGRVTTEYLDHGGTQQQATTFSYDTVGNLKTETRWPGDGTNPTTTYEYDRLNRLVKTTLPDADGNPNTPNGLVTNFAYDVAGNLIRTTNGEGESTRRQFNEQGLVVVESDGNGDETHYRYDSEGNLLALTDAEDNTTTYTHDGLDRLTSETIVAEVGGTPTPLVRTYVYGTVGNLASIVDRNGRVRKFGYDSLERRKQEQWFDDTSDTTPNVTFTWQYDKLGRVTQESNGSFISTYVYDGLGRLVQYDTPTVPAGMPSVRQTFEYSFGETITYPAETVTFHDVVTQTQYLRDSQGVELPLAKTTRRYDRLGRLEESRDTDASSSSSTPQIAEKVLSFSYDTLGNLSSIGRASSAVGPASTFAYDRADRLTQIDHGDESSWSWVGHFFGYDSASRVISFDSSGSESATETRSYAYDDAGQLTAAPGSGGSYAYDDNGNRTSATGQPDVVTALANRLTDDGTHTYQYDNEGNLTLRTLKSDPTKTTVYTWNHRNQLSVVKELNGTAVTREIRYVYDASGRRWRRQIDADGGPTFVPVNEYYVYNGAIPTPPTGPIGWSDSGQAELSMRFDHSGQLTHRYLYGPAVDQVLVDESFRTVGSQRVTDDVLWLLADHQGTVRSIVSNNGSAIVARKDVSYDSFGRITNEQYYGKTGATISPTHAEAVDQAFSHTGLWRDKSTNMLFADHRVYDPSTGRWLSEDPSGFDGGDSNLYRFVGNDPVNFTDPTGLKQAGNPLATRSLIDPISVLTRPPSGTDAVRQSSAGQLDRIINEPGYLERQTFVAHFPAPRVSSAPKLTDNEILKNYFNSPDFHAINRAEDERAAFERAQHFIQQGTPSQAFVYQLGLGLNSLAESANPIARQLSVLDTLTNENATITQKAVALTAGLVDTFFQSIGTGVARVPARSPGHVTAGPVATSAPGKNFISSGHLTAAAGEYELIQQAQKAGEVVLKVNRTVTNTGADLVTYNPRSGQVTLWDNKATQGTLTPTGARAPRTTSPSQTLNNQGRLQRVLDNAQDAIQNSGLSPADRARALQSIENETYRKVTRGSGNAANSIIQYGP